MGVARAVASGKAIHFAHFGCALGVGEFLGEFLPFKLRFSASAGTASCGMMARKSCSGTEKGQRWCEGRRFAYLNGIQEVAGSIPAGSTDGDDIHECRSPFLLIFPTRSRRVDDDKAAR